MSLGIIMTGSVPHALGSASQGLRRIAEWVSERCGDMLETPVGTWEADGRRGMTIDLHPCAEGVIVELGAEGEILVEAKTSSAGPGYHQYVCELIDALGVRFDIQWAAPVEGESEDETGYYTHRRRELLELEMVTWLQAVTKSLAEHEEIGESIALSMSLDHQFDAQGMIVTPMGPRTKEWADATARGALGVGGLEGPGGFFAWWDEGETARTRLNRALARMWAQVRWAPARTEGESRVIERTLRDLNAAWRAEPELDFPWREWVELSELAGEEPAPGNAAHVRAAEAEGPLIGYRRHPVRVLLPGGWRIRIPGDFSEMYEEEGGFLAWGEERNVRVSSFSVVHRNAEGRGCHHPTPLEMVTDEADPEMPPPVEVLEAWERDGVAGAAKVYRDTDDGMDYWILMGKVASPDRLALCTVCYVRDEDRAWAVDTLRSIRRGE